MGCQSLQEAGRAGDRMKRIMGDRRWRTGQADHRRLCEVRRVAIGKSEVSATETSGDLRSCATTYDRSRSPPEMKWPFGQLGS